MANDRNSPAPEPQRAAARQRDEFARLTTFQRMRELRRRGQSLTPSPITIVEEDPGTGLNHGRIPTYESVSAFSRRTGLPLPTIDELIARGTISCLRLERDGNYVNVRKALSELENLEQSRKAS